MGNGRDFQLYQTSDPDHAFFDCEFQPWALRNVLDAFSGALPGTGYSFESALYNPAGAQVSSHGFSFYHDMGLWPNSGTGPAYGSVMGDEELQAWILSAGLYWSRTTDNAWLTNNAALLQACLNSMLVRDNTNSTARRNYKRTSMPPRSRRLTA